MPIYTPGRRRTILILLLSSVLLITVDLRGNALLDAARSGFDYAFRPFEIAAEVVSRPIVRTWDGITRVDDLERENAELRRQIDQQRSAQIAGQNAMIQNRQLRATLDLKSLANLDRVSCSTIGPSPSNQDQTVEIDCGTLDGLRTGMPVINDAGLVGKITHASPETAVVRLVTDPSYAVYVKIVGEREPEPPAPVDSTPSGIPTDSIADIADQLTTTSTSSTTTTIVAPLAPGDTVPPVSDATPPEGTPTTSAPLTSEPTPSTDPTSGTTTTTVPVTTTTVRPSTRETGLLQGFGPDRLPRVGQIEETPQFGLPRVGDVVLTTGGGRDLYPPDIPVGFVANVIRRPGAEGILLEVEPSADLSRLEFLTVLLYQPSTELR